MTNRKKNEPISKDELCALLATEPKSPESGQLLAYTRNNVYFQQYEDLEEVENLLKGQVLLELRLFDDEKEARFLSTTSHRFKDVDRGFLHNLITKEDIPNDSGEFCFSETVYLDMNDEERLTVLNHVNYDENGMAYVDNHRLKMGGTKE